MNNNEERKEILIERYRVNKNNWYFDDGEKLGFFTYDTRANEMLSTLYVNFEVSKEFFVDGHDKPITRVLVSDRRAFDILKDLLEENDYYHFWEAVIEVEYMFSKTLKDFLKFRGDLAEAIVCYLWGAEKNISDKDSTDLLYNGDKIEIKSISANTTQIEISKEQSDNRVDTYAVLLSQSKREEGGMSMVEIATNLKGGNSAFKTELLRKYLNTDIGTLNRYIVEEKQITNITHIVQNSITSEHMISAKLRLPSYLFKSNKEQNQ